MGRETMESYGELFEKKKKDCRVCKLADSNEASLESA
jgi:hypothetical protein